ADLVLDAAIHPVDLPFFDRLGAKIFLYAVARADFHGDDGACGGRGRLERRVADVAGLLTEDRAKQLLFRSELRLALRRDFADEDVALLDGRADADDAALVEIAQCGFADVRNVASDFFGTELRIARFDLEFFDV